MMVLGDLLPVENDPAILRFRFSFDDVLMWPFIRAYLFEKAISRAYLWAPHPFALKGARGIPEWLGYIRKAWQKRPEGKNIGHDRNDIIIFSGDISNFRKGGCYFNKISDYFAFAFEDRTLVIEDSNKGRFSTPRCYRKVLYHDIIRFRSLLASKIVRPDGEDIRTIESFLGYLENRFPCRFEPAVWREASCILSSLSARLRVYHRFYTRLFDECRPRLVMLEDGCYGARSYIIKWAKERGIHAAEPQHGTIYRNHYAYNYGGEMLKSGEYRRYLPDFLLTYGPYWNSETNVPAEKVAIGNPHYCERLKSVDRTAARFPGKSVILIASSSMNPDRVVRFATSLADIADPARFAILFRPHPSERPLIRERYGEMIGSAGIRIDEEADVYSTLAEARILVSEPSTIIFEAMGLCDRIFILDGPSVEFYFSGSPFQTVREGRDIFDGQGGLRPRGAASLDVQDIWSRDWKSKYRHFIDTLIPREAMASQ